MIDASRLGYACLLLALGCSIYGTLVPLLGLRYRSEALVRSAGRAVLLSFGLLGLASVVLWRALLLDDFRLRFVWQNASADMPTLYKFAAFWGGMEGSLLLWTLLMGFCSSVVAVLHRRRHPQLYPYLLSVLSAISVFLLLVLGVLSDPFALDVPAPAEGRGLNPLLQHPAMATHPPLLYLGYIGFSVPFAFAVAALLCGRIDNRWLFATRRWVLVSWYALTVGQLLGGLWAYEELGWGGYWGWDPVENAAFMPWLTGTALLHSLMLQEKRHMMRVWNMVLIMLTFSLGLLGTFIVRSGVLNSVHAFAESSFGPVFLVYIGVVFIGSLVLLFRRLPLLKSPHTADELVSKETTFLLNNLLFLSLAFTVFLGTLFPLISEAVSGTKLSIQAPFFNTLAAPLGLALLILLGVCTLTAWRKSSPGLLLRNLRLPLGFALLGALALLLLGVRQLGALVLYAAVAFTGSILLLDFFRASRARMRQYRMGFAAAMVFTFRRNLQRWGGALIHLGVVLLFLGLGGNLFNQEQIRVLTPGQTFSLGPYLLRYVSLVEQERSNHTLRAAQIQVFRQGTRVETLYPGRSYYSTQPEPLTEVAIRRTLAHDLYLVLAAEDGSASIAAEVDSAGQAAPPGTITLRARLNPLVSWVFLSLPLVTLGFICSMLHSPPFLRRRAADLTPPADLLSKTLGTSL